MSMPGWEVDGPGEDSLESPPEIQAEGPSAIEEPMDVLEQINIQFQKMQNGEITPEEYEQSKEKLMEQM